MYNVSNPLVYQHTSTVLNTLKYDNDQLCSSAFALLALGCVGNDMTPHTSTCNTPVINCSTRQISYDNESNTHSNGSSSSSELSGVSEYSPFTHKRKYDMHMSELHLPAAAHKRVSVLTQSRSLFQCNNDMHSGTSNGDSSWWSADKCTINIERPFHCSSPGCNKSFKKANAVRRHMRCHTGMDIQ